MQVESIVFLYLGLYFLVVRIGSSIAQVNPQMVTLGLEKIFKTDLFWKSAKLLSKHFSKAKL